MPGTFEHKLSEAKNVYFPETPTPSRVDQLMEGFLDGATSVAGKIASGIANMPGKLKDFEKATAQAAELSRTDGVGAVKQLYHGATDSKIDAQARATWDRMTKFQKKQFDQKNAKIEALANNKPEWARYKGLVGFDRFKVERNLATHYANEPKVLKDLDLIKVPKPSVQPGSPEWDKKLQDQYGRLNSQAKQKYTFDQYKQIQNDLHLKN